MCDYHLNDLTTLLHFQIEVYSKYACANTRLGVQKCIFCASHARARDFSTPLTDLKTLKTAR